MNYIMQLIGEVLALHPEPYNGFLVIANMIFLAIIGIYVVVLWRQQMQFGGLKWLIVDVAITAAWIVLYLLQALMLAHPAFPGIYW